MWLFFLSFLFLATPGSCDGAFFGSGSDATAGDDGVRTFYVLDFDVENLGASFIAFNGTMVAPNVQGAGVYYLWPGLEPPGSQGVYQNVLAGDTTDWTFSTGWCCINPDTEFGDAIKSQNGDPNTFTNIADGNGNWNSLVVNVPSGQQVPNSYPLGDKQFTRASLAIELHQTTWNFGALVWQNLALTATGTTDTSWCDNGPKNDELFTSFNRKDK
ncbi:hypothetical protein P8C59_002749 [Phyllachora maydis]|uniref:Uncharacterized protein n=1 Tax=Phyllachora maydis TaxID=1825666 RepID=A0AAD9I011_9PEZI|nr:hypothetical protein P8C59_002749 [Phyllachora maydis]